MSPEILACGLCGSDTDWAWDSLSPFKEDPIRALCDNCADYDTPIGYGATKDDAIDDFQDKAEHWPLDTQP